jgi:tRNA pseudouridine38-40 synthase
MRYFFQISYLGTRYNGWQSQINAVGIQQILEKVMSTVLQEKIVIVGSGRTDTGVHSIKQYFHCDIEKTFDRDRLIIQLNSYLPKDIAIHDIRKVKQEANARFDAFERTYEYHITRIKDPLKTGLAFHYFKEANLQTMNKAAALLLGSHDFECFSKVHTDVNHFICDIKEARWNQKKDLLVFTITGNRFLRSMVRAVVGTLLDVGSGKISMKEFQDVLKSKDRKKAGMNVPADGLFLVNVKYPRSIFLKW